MPITGPSSYVPTAEEFAAHWNNADTELGVGNELVLPDGTAQAAFNTKKDDLVAKRTELTGKLNDKEGARGDIENQKAALIERVVQFNDKIRAFFGESKYVRMLPDAPSQTAGQSAMLAALTDANSVWQKVNADPATTNPVTLLGGYDQATFDTDVTTLRTAYSTLTTAETDSRFIREQRNDLQDEIYGMMRSYRQVLRTLFAKGHALVDTLPRLSPTPGSTPDPVNVTAVWDATEMKARITWDASTDPNLDNYQVRMSPGPDYSTEDETLIQTVAPIGPLEVLTDAGLLNPGDMASFKVYVVLTTGNEKGSAAHTVTHPPI